MPGEPGCGELAEPRSWLGARCFSQCVDAGDVKCGVLPSGAWGLGSQGGASEEWWQTSKGGTTAGQWGGGGWVTGLGSEIPYAHL